jgi:hypothetical protein
MREFVGMRDEEHRFVLVDQRPCDLSGDLRALPLVGRGERFVEQEERVRREMVHDLAHSFQFFIELAALHRRIFLTLVMREETVAHAGPERRRRHEHPALHHELSQPDTAQERRLPSLVRTGDDDEQLVVAIHIVADDLPLPGERQAHVVQPLAREPPLVQWCRYGKAGRLAPSCELVMQIGAAYVERQFGAQRPKETENVIGGLR